MEFCFALRFAFSSDFSTEIQQQWAATSTPTPPLPTPPLPPSRRPFAQPPFLSVHGRVCECSTCVCVSADFSGDRLSGLTLPTPKQRVQFVKSANNNKINTLHTILKKSNITIFLRIFGDGVYIVHWRSFIPNSQTFTILSFLCI